MSIGQYSFLSWARRGMGAQIGTRDPLGASAIPLRPSVPLSLHLNTTFRVDRTVELRGPGDVTGLDPRAVIRTDPLAGVTDFEPNYLVSLELYDEDLPWRYTPAQATTQQRLRPWITLVVLAAGELERGPIELAITVANAASLFPPARQTWAWAHVHVNASLGGDPAVLDPTVAANPDIALARLLCPRRLQPDTAYTAFVIPTFESGRRAGLGLDVPSALDGGAPAWGAGQTTFPVYYEWSFRTGHAGDFESLARLLQPRVLDPRIGLRDMDVQHPADGLVAGITAPPILGLEGALRTVDTELTDWPRTGEAFPAQLAQVVNTQFATSGDPIVAPPLYGRWHGASPGMRVPESPSWLETLNADPRHRVAAGFGAEVIRREQEAFAAAAWSQLGAVLEANRLLVLAQLGRAVARSLHVRHIATLDADRVLALLAPIHKRVKAGAVTVREQIRTSALPGVVMERTFRRVVRRAGPIARRFFAAEVTAPRWTTRLNAREVTAEPPKPVPEHALLVDAIDLRLLSLQPTTAARARDRGTIAATPARPAFRVTRPGEVPDNGPPHGADAAEAARFRGALLALHDELSKVPSAPPPLPSLPLADLRAKLVESTEPTRTIQHRVLARFRMPDLDLGVRSDPLETIMAAPSIDLPMYKPLAAISSDRLLPNVELISQNTVSLLLTNNRFIESYLVGLNHEMARELLWREYPTDQRGSYFRCFWDTRDALGGTATRDIDAIHTWARDSQLGDHVRGGGDRLVLVIRGDILKKYPTAVITAVDAVWPSGEGKRELGNDERYPLFHAELAPDLTLLGFDLSTEQVKGSAVRADNKPGWFFVIKQRPGEPRFGLDETSPLTVATSWDGLWWGNVAPGPNIDLTPALDHVDIPDHQRWGQSAAEMASILFQRPILIAIHASEMLP